MGSSDDHVEPLLQHSVEGLEGNGANAEVGLHVLESPPSLTSFPTGQQIKGELGRQWTLALPVLITVFLQVLLTTLTSIFAGHIGAEALATASLGTSVYNSTGFWILSGLAGAVDTLAGQAFGAKQYRKLGEIVQRGLVLNTVACIPIGVLWLNAEKVLLTLGQDPQISASTARFLVGLFPGLLGSAWRVPLVRYLAAQRSVQPVAGCAAIAVGVHVLVNYVLAFRLGYGLLGISYAFSVTQVFYFVLLMGYVLCSKIRETTWTSWSWSATFSGLGLHLSLALPSMVMVCLEQWSYELSLFLAGLLPNPTVQLSTVNIALNLMMLAFTFGSGWSVAISVRVSNELGANCPERARLAAIASLAMSLLSGATVSLILFFSRSYIGQVFTDSKAIIDLTAQLVPILCVTAAADTIQFTMAGVLRGSGKQRLGAACNLFSYYAVGIPAAILIAFHYGLGARGLWLGLALALLSCLSVYSFLASRLDWEAEARKAQARVCIIK